MKIEKCQLGYIHQQKLIHWLWLAVFLALGVVIFLIGFWWTHTKANVLTVLAILMVLPAAKRIVSLVVFMPRKGVGQERYDKMKEKVKDAILLTEYVFTSTEKIMHLDFLVIKDGHVLAVVSSSIQDREYMKKYLEENVHRIAPDYLVEVFDQDEDLMESLSGQKEVEHTSERDQKLLSHLRVLAV